MDTKKSPRANLNKYSSLFMWLGLVFVLFVTWRVIEYKKYEKDNFQDEKWNVNAEDLEETYEVEKIQPEQQQPKQKVEVPEVIEKVEDEEDIEEPTFEDTETDEEEIIEEEEIETVEPEEDVQVAFQFVESPPVYPGCEKYVNNKKKLKECISKKVERFISRKFNRDIADELGLTGVIRINVQFVVDKDGRVTNVRARSTKSKLLEKEAIRVVKQMPKWKPGEQRGKKVKVVYNLPIIFQVE